MAQVWLMSSRIVNNVSCKLSSKETFYKWWHFKLDLIFYLKHCFSYLGNHVLPSSLDICGVPTFKYQNWHWWDFVLVTYYECLF